MTPGDTARVLGKAAAFDNRTVGETDIAAWHEILGYLDVRDCLAAITTHYSEQRDRAMPADIRRLAITIRDDRNRRERQAIEPAPVHHERSEDVKRLVQAVVDALPSTTIHDRALAQARKERGRQPAPKPATKRKLPPPKDFPPPADDAIAALTTRYLLDGHHPADVANRLGVSRRWCELTLHRLRGDQRESA